TAGGDRPELALAGIVVEAQPPVVEISPQRIALPDGVAERARDRTADPANALEDGLGPRENVVEHRAREVLSPLLSLSRSKACPVLFELEERANTQEPFARGGLLHGDCRLPHPPSAMRPTRDFVGWLIAVRDRFTAEERIVNAMRVGLDITREALE